MSDLSYTPTFHHTPWIDNVDRVKAGGPDGFNVRFEAIDSDLHQVSTVVTAIGDQLDAAGDGSPSGMQRLLVPLDPTSDIIPGAGAWTCDVTGAIHPEQTAGTPAPSSAATMDVSLPDHATLVSIRVVGLYQSSTAHVTVRLQRNSLFDIAISADPLVQATIEPGHGSPYNVTESVTSAFADVDNGQFRYALLFGATSVFGNDIITVDSVELRYTLP